MLLLAVPFTHLCQQQDTLDLSPCPAQDTYPLDCLSDPACTRWVLKH